MNGPTMLSDLTLEYGERAARALLGVDALYRLESGDEDGMVVLNMAGEALEAEEYDGYSQAAEAWQVLDRDASALPEVDRRLYYHQLCESTLAFIKWRTEGLSLADQLSHFLHVPAAPVSEAQLDALRAELGALLTQMGYSGNLSQQCSVWQDAVRVPPDQVSATLETLFSEAWDRTNRILPIPAPKSDGMHVQTVSGVAFNARCNYPDRLVELNIDPVLTLPGLKHLAVHECYPGHYVQFKLREVGYAMGSATADGLLSVVNTASSSPFEGIADNGLELLDWYAGDDDRVQHVLTRYRSALGTVAAWRLHAQGESPSEVAHWLAANSLAGGIGWVESRMRFISAPSRAVLIWSYWWGQEVTRKYRDVPTSRRPDFLRYLYGRMHSLQSVALFQ
jgi:hypothetical protein